MSKYFLEKLNSIKSEHPDIIKEIRGRGLLIGIQLHNNPTLFIKKIFY